MKAIIRRKLTDSKRRIERRLDKTDLRGCDKPMMTASNIHDEIGDRCRGCTVGGIGAIHTLAQQLGLVAAIDQDLHLLKIHLPYHEKNKGDAEDADRSRKQKRLNGPPPRVP